MRRYGQKGGTKGNAGKALGLDSLSGYQAGTASGLWGTDKAIAQPFRGLPGRPIIKESCKINHLFAPGIIHLNVS